MVNRLEKFQSSYWNKDFQLILVMHVFLFGSILLLALVFFKGDLLSTLWASYKNDSWKFVRNTFLIENPPFPYHLITTSMHFFPLYVIFNFVFSIELSMTLSILIVQFIFSLVAIYTLYIIFKDTFNLNKEIFLYLWIIDSIFFSLFFILATAEILFLFYQIMTVLFFIRGNYLLGSAAAGMTLALRFNGVFFLIGSSIILFFYHLKSKFSSGKLTLYLLIMGIFALIPFFYSLFISNNFFLPITSEYTAYTTWESYVPEGNIIMLPFTFWPLYITWVFAINSQEEYLLLFAGIFSFILSLTSIYYLNISRRNNNEENQFKIVLLEIFAISWFLGTNIIVSGRNFARFITFGFPTYVILLGFIKTIHRNRYLSIIFIIGSYLIAIILNVIWWIFTDPCELCKHLII